MNSVDSKNSMNRGSKRETSLLQRTSEKSCDCHTTMIHQKQGIAFVSTIDARRVMVQLQKVLASKTFVIRLRLTGLQHSFGFLGPQINIRKKQSNLQKLRPKLHEQHAIITKHTSIHYSAKLNIRKTFLRN